MTRVLIICGSNSRDSKSVTLTQQISKQLSLWAVYLNSYEFIPLLTNEIINKREFPPSIKYLSEKILEHDILVLVFPQYNYNFSGFFKNVLDWCSLHTKKIFLKKRIVLVGVSSSRVGEEEFEKITSWTCYSLGAEEIVFFNKTPNENLEDFISQIGKYV
ncbi:NAD(P)H-dependent oxidoreductase [Mycoplasma suis]|uniref:NADPH-dependent FMN reductase n=2 Tax=Mycoplasma suis TaxID=57372 RepID=F0QQZ2_MYCSL|nr:NADPH-dependent FMN reductase [Mycoplasma suis]ADX97912.1 NADPH-dependent FMN reductase [Mycoplasma suis str. Illinois]CBZ40412.1 Predicted flavoprotein [Mycoplasma suis KI3806]